MVQSASSRYIVFFGRPFEGINFGLAVVQAFLVFSSFGDAHCVTSDKTSLDCFRRLPAWIEGRKIKILTVELSIWFKRTQNYLCWCRGSSEELIILHKCDSKHFSFVLSRKCTLSSLVLVYKDYTSVKSLQYSNYNHRYLIKCKIMEL